MTPDRKTLDPALRLIGHPMRPPVRTLPAPGIDHRCVAISVRSNRIDRRNREAELDDEVPMNVRHLVVPGDQHPGLPDQPRREVRQHLLVGQAMDFEL